jgi:hypothetical protein
LGGVHVLELVDADVAEACLPARTQRSVRIERIRGTHDQVVEVDGAAGGQDGPTRLHQRRVGRRASLDFPRRDLGVQGGGIREWWTIRPRFEGCPSQDGAQKRQPIADQGTPSRAISVVVLPLPADAMTSAGPSGSVAAKRCSVSRPATSPCASRATDGIASCVIAAGWRVPPTG